MDPSTEHPDVLADVRLARRALSRPQVARLLVDGSGPDGPAPVQGVELMDSHGTPVLVCDPDSALAQASRDRRTATLTLVGDPEDDGDPQPAVVMRGRLSPMCADRIEDREVELVELVLVGVQVAGGVGARACGTVRRVELVDYLHEPAELLDAYVADVLAHSNRDHGPQLRSFAALISGVPASAVASAHLAGLDRDGFSVAWIDVEGAHRVRLLFADRACTRRQLSALLAQSLCAHDDTGSGDVGQAGPE